MQKAEAWRAVGFAVADSEQLEEINMRIFGLYIGSSANIDRLENALQAANRKVRDYEQNVGTLQSSLNMCGERAAKLSEAHEQKLVNISTHVRNVQTSMTEVSKLIDYRNGEDYKTLNPKQKAQWPADLADSYAKANEQMNLLHKCVASD